MAGISRNAPCPCGSGKKYKQCCEGHLSPKKRLHLIIGLVLAIAATGTAAGIVSWETSLRNGLFTAILGAILIGGYLALRDPPASRGRAGADRIDFGR